MHAADGADGKISSEDRLDEGRLSRRKKSKSNNSKERLVKWGAFAKGRKTMTFDHLAPKFHPSMFENRRGLALYLDKVDGWRLPKNVFEQLGNGQNRLSLQLSMSLFHLSTGTFFGSTWMGPRMPLEDVEKAFTRDIEVQFKEMIYLISRINDETCVGVVEIVVGKEDEEFGIISGQFGCGWTMINLFSKNIPPDAADGRDEVKLMSCPIFAGSPRELVMGGQNIEQLARSLREIPDCFLFFKLFSHRRLLKMQRHVAENTTIGRYDSVAGLVQREVVPPGSSQGVFLPCIGDEETMRTRDGIQVYPGKPKLALFSTIKVADCQLFIPKRHGLEVRVIEATLPGFPIEKRADVKVLTRILRFGLHNGHCVLGTLQAQLLLEDKEDQDILLTQDPVLTIQGYVPDSNMTLVFSIEYVIGVPLLAHERQDPRESLRVSVAMDVKPPLSTTVTIGCSAYVPSDGTRVFLRNVKAPVDERPDADSGLNVELPILRDFTCSLITTAPVASVRDLNKQMHLSVAADGKDIVDDLRKSFAAKSLAGSKYEEQKPGKSSAPIGGTKQERDQRAREQEEALDNTATMGFDLKVLHPVRGELRHEDFVDDLLKMTDRDVKNNAAASKMAGQLVGAGEGGAEDEAPVFNEEDPDDDRRGRKGDDKSRKSKADAKHTHSDEEDDDDRDGRLRRRVGKIIPKKRGSTGKHRQNAGSFDDDNASVADSLVSGDSQQSALKLDPYYYGGLAPVGGVSSGLSHRQPDTAYVSRRGRHDSDVENTSEHSFAMFQQDMKQNKKRSQLAQALMQAKFRPRRVDILRDEEESGPGNFSHVGYDTPSALTAVHRARKTSVPLMHNDYFLRTLTRGAKARLNRFGIQDAIVDTAEYHQLGAAPNGPTRSARGAVDIELEAFDSLSLHEISLQFAGFRLGTNSSVSSAISGVSVLHGLSSHMVAPRAIYFSFQFFTCPPTRTEDLRLLSADHSNGLDGETSKRASDAQQQPVHVLVRDDPRAPRDEPGLVIRFAIDTSKSSPFEALEFAQYLAHKSLYIDVWDADSLLPLGTFGVPLRLLMRQGAHSVKHAIECDVINAQSVSPSYGGVTAMTIVDSGPISGEQIGAVQCVITNYGLKGHGPFQHSNNNAAISTGDGPSKGNNSKNRQIMVPIEGLNWRAHGGQDQVSLTSYRPKTVVQARPLTATAPELSRALTDLRSTAGNSLSYRSLSLAGRDGGGVSTLNYDEVVCIFRRFQGIAKGTVQYAGGLLQLMDLPSIAVMMRKMVRLYKLYGDKTALHNAFLQHANGAEHLAKADIDEALRQIGERTGVVIKPDERQLFAQKVMAQVPGEKTISATALMKYLSNEVDRADWVLVQGRLRVCAQKAELDGVDVEQLLARYDTQGTHYIATRHFRDFLLELARFGKLTQSDVNLTCRFFARHDRDLEAHDPVSLMEVMASLGKTYVGNLQARVRKLLVKLHSGEGAGAGGDESALPEAKYILRLLSANASTEGVAIAQPGQYCHVQVEQAFRALGIMNELSHAQVRSIVQNLDVRKSGLITAAQVLTYLGIPFRASDLPSSSAQAPTKAGSGGLSLDTDDLAPASVPMDAEYLLRLLLQKAQSNGLQIDQAFRHFDANGDGQISRAELTEGLQKLAIFEGIPKWQEQMPGVLAKFDSSGDGLVSLREFFQFLGIEDYGPNIVQRLTKIFSVATEKGLSIQRIFQELDVDKNGTLDTAELREGLQKMGSFEQVSDKDIGSVIQIFDSDGNQKISIDEFVAYFSERVARDQKRRKMKNGLKVAQRFREVMRAAQGKGASLQAIFAHLDKDKGGSVSTTELATALSSMPNFKSLSKEDIADLLTAIDSDNSGDVTLEEFENFVNAGQPVVSGQTIDILEQIRQTFGAALTKGLSLEKEFQLVDQDRSGRISRNELEKIITKMPSFKSISKADMTRLFDTIDVDRSGLITAAEFEIFVKRGKEAFVAKVEEKKKEAEAAEATVKREQSEKMRAVEDNNKRDVNETSKERFIRHMRRIAEIDGSLRALLAYLDDDEDGLIRKQSLLNLLRREDVFETVPQAEVEDILSPFITSKSSSDHYSKGGYDSKHGDDARTTGDMIAIVPFLSFLEQRKYQPKVVADLDELDKDMIQEKEYVFSRDPEVHAVERKLRSFGRILARKGVDVEEEFVTYDNKNTGCVARTDFVKVLGKLGMYLLEEGKVLQQERQNDPDHAIRQRQIRQLKHMKGAEGMFVSQAPQLARKMFRDADAQGGVPVGEFKNHLESLTVIDWYRQGQKQQLIQHVLSHSLAHTIRLYPRFGQTLFFEYPITNPFNHEERFVFDLSNDPELRLVTQMTEWLHLRQLVHPCVGVLGANPVEVDMFDRDEQTGHVSVTLLPHETLYIPFTYLTLIPYVPPTRQQQLTLLHNDQQQRLQEQRRAGGRADDRDEEDDQEGKEAEEALSNHLQRVISVKIVSGSHGHIVAILKVVVTPRPYVVHRVLRFYEFEHSIARRKVKVVGLQPHAQVGDYYLGGALGQGAGHPGSGMKYLHCVETTNEATSGLKGGPHSDVLRPSQPGGAPHAPLRSAQETSRVVVEWGAQLKTLGVPGEDGHYSSHHSEEDDLHSLDMLIRYRCGAAPTCGSFHLLLFNDPYQATLHEVWQVMVHARLRLDVHATVGTANAADLVLRGDTFPRRVRAFALPTPTHALAFKPENTFQLVPGAYNRVLTVVRPKISGSKKALVNVIDVDSKELLAGWLVHIQAGNPAVSRCYDVDVPINQPIYKKILFKNPWDSRRRYVLSSSDEEIMRVRGGSQVIDMAGGGSAYIRLWFKGWVSGERGVKEVHLFLNDAEESHGSTEECHLFRVMESTSTASY